MRTRFIGLAISISPLILVVLLWEWLALSGKLPPALFPDLSAVAIAFVQLIKSGVLIHAAIGTLIRLFAGFVIAAFIGLLVGFLMGRYEWAEDVFLPVVSVGYPIPSLAYAPLFVLWFGLGNSPSIILVAIAGSFSIAINTWKGVKAIKVIWLRAAEGMSANERFIFWKVVLPASLPYILTGLRIGLASAWRILVGVEMLTSVSNGLGSLIFGAQQFLNTDVMLSGVIMIGAIGFTLEKLVFEKIERITLARWGMIT